MRGSSKEAVAGEKRKRGIRLWGGGSYVTKSVNSYCELFRTHDLYDAFFVSSSLVKIKIKQNTMVHTPSLETGISYTITNPSRALLEALPSSTH